MSNVLSLVQARLYKLNMISKAFFGAIFLSLMSQIALPLPFTPIPMTMQMMGVFLIGGTMSAPTALLSVLFYLIAATLGMPVDALHSSIDPIWYLGSTAGYFIGFALAASTMGFLIQKHARPSFAYLMMALTVGELIVLGCGALWLSYFVGFQQALVWGVYPFIIIDALKMAAAASLLKLKNSYIN